MLNELRKQFNSAEVWKNNRLEEVEKSRINVCQRKKGCADPIVEFGGKKERSRVAGSDLLNVAW
jgi:hypothetical protein